MVTSIRPPKPVYAARFPLSRCSATRGTDDHLERRGGAGLSRPPLKHSIAPHRTMHEITNRSSLSQHDCSIGSAPPHSFKSPRTSIKPYATPCRMPGLPPVWRNRRSNLTGCLCLGYQRSEKLCGTSWSQPSASSHRWQTRKCPVRLYTLSFQPQLSTAWLGLCPRTGVRVGSWTCSGTTTRLRQGCLDGGNPPLRLG